MELHTYCEETPTETIKIIATEPLKFMPAECVLAMLELRGSERYMNLFEDRHARKINLWNSINVELQEMGYDFTTAQYQQKFLNLRKTYVQYRINMKKPGAKPMRRPRFFDEMHNIFKSKYKMGMSKVKEEDFLTYMKEDDHSSFTAEEIANTPPEEQQMPTVESELPMEGTQSELPEETETDVVKLLHMLIEQQKESNTIMMMELQHRKEMDEKMLQILEKLTYNTDT